jgi:hypothetical protein
MGQRMRDGYRHACLDPFVNDDWSEASSAGDLNGAPKLTPINPG